ncbi:putative polyprotein [Tanacetum coccineum]
MSERFEQEIQYWYDNSRIVDPEYITFKETSPKPTSTDLANNLACSETRKSLQQISTVIQQSKPLTKREVLNLVQEIAEQPKLVEKEALRLTEDLNQKIQKVEHLLHEVKKLMVCDILDWLKNSYDAPPRQALTIEEVYLQQQATGWGDVFSDNGSYPRKGRKDLHKISKNFLMNTYHAMGIEQLAYKRKNQGLSRNGIKPIAARVRAGGDMEYITITVDSNHRTLWTESGCEGVVMFCTLHQTHEAYGAVIVISRGREVYNTKIELNNHKTSELITKQKLAFVENIPWRGETVEEVNVTFLVILLATMANLIP